MLVPTPIATHHRSFGGVLAALVLAPALACSPMDEPELLRVTSLSPDRLVAGAELSVAGEGFPSGRDGLLRLEGECRAPGALAHRVFLERPLHASAADQATASIDGALVRRVGGRASCRLDGLVRFTGPERAVVGRIHDVHLDFVASGRENLVSRLADAERGRHVARRLGLAFAEEMPEAGGLVVATVAPRSMATRAGIVAGDVVLSIDGVRLYELADFVPTPGFARTALDVRSMPSGTVRTLHASTFVASDAPSMSTLGYALLALVVLITLAFLSPFARAIDWLAQKPPSDPEATLAWLFGVAPSDASRRARLLSNALIVLGILGMSASFAGIAVIGRLLVHDFGVGILLSASLALRMAARVFGETRDTDHGPLLPFFVASTPLTIAVVSVGLLVGTGHLGELHAAQGVVPSRWLVFAQPIAFALFPVFAATALTRVEPEATTSGLAKVAARAHLLVVSCLGAALFLGGWATPANPTPLIRALCVAFFVLKVWGLLGLGLWARSVTPGTGDNAWKWTVPVAVLGLGSACFWTYADLPIVVERASGYVLAAFAATVLTYVIVARLRPTREPTLVLHPFL